jgi:YfiH family protein
VTAPLRREGEHLACDLPGGRVLFTTRRGGISSAPYDTLNLGRLTDDDPDAVEANHERLAALTGIARHRTAQGRQVHGARVERVARPPAAGRLVEADGQATALEGVAALVLTADCLPVALVAPEAVAMVHAGWRGLAAGVLEEGVAALRELGAQGAIAAVVGPGARRCCYEVGDEVRSAFAEHGDDVRHGGNLDLALVARRRLRAVGVGDVVDCALCTICDAERRFFSHRRDGGITGRQAGVTWRA